MTDIPNHCHEHGCSFLVMCAKTSLCVCYLHIGRPFLLCSTQHINYVLFMFNLFIIKLKSTEQSSLFFFAVVLGLLMWVLTTACTLWSSRFRSVPFPGPYTLTQVRILSIRPTQPTGLTLHWLACCLLKQQEIKHRQWKRQSFWQYRPVHQGCK